MLRALSLSGVLLCSLANKAHAQDAGTPDGGIVDSARGFDAGSTYERLALDYNCPAAPAPVDLGDAGWLYPPARVLRTNCLIAGASAEAFRWRDLADAGSITPSSQSNTLHLVISTTAAILSAWTVYAQSREARHLPLWPP